MISEPALMKYNDFRTHCDDNELFFNKISKISKQSAKEIYNKYKE